MRAVWSALKAERTTAGKLCASELHRNSFFHPRINLLSALTQWLMALVYPLSPKGTSWEMKPSGSITWHLPHHSGLGLGVGNRSVLPGSATFRLQSCLPWESVAGHLWIMMCGNLGFYFCKSLAGCKSWWQDPWAQQENTNDRSRYRLVHFYFPSLCLPFLFFPFFLSL